MPEFGSDRRNKRNVDAVFNAETQQGWFCTLKQNLLNFQPNMEAVLMEIMSFWTSCIKVSKKVYLSILDSQYVKAAKGYLRKTVRNL